MLCRVLSHRHTCAQASALAGGGLCVWVCGCLRLCRLVRDCVALDEAGDTEQGVVAIAGVMAKGEVC